MVVDLTKQYVQLWLGQFPSEALLPTAGDWRRDDNDMKTRENLFENRFNLQ
jgi:hypothetical protein